MSSKDKTEQWAVLASVIDYGEFVEIAMNDVTKDAGIERKWTQREHVTRKKAATHSLRKRRSQ